jgi:selenocysteine-specific elongation factor
MSAPRLILGTAGHIDHGKTSLVRALTGVETDRLPEEKARGITIELGFAPCALPGGVQLGIVDVPGHEKLVRTMVAGATGIDLVLFAIAADEGMMPQSREHLAICDLLGIEVGVVALTKADLVDDELLELARLEAAEELAATALAGSQLVAVSTLDGRGLDALRRALADAAARCGGRTLRDGPAWLCVDRAFSVHGFGTVVTGTLRGARLEEGQAIELLPENARAPLAARIRGLEVHGEKVARAEPGSRCAVNLPGIELDAVPRGSVLATPGRLDYRPRIAAELRVLPGAPAVEDGASFTAHLGTAERRARVLVLSGPRIDPGQSGAVELRFDRPVPAVEGDRFILRGFRRIADAGWTVGGGRILDTRPERRRRRSERAADLAAAGRGDARGALAARLARAGLRGALETELLRELRSLEGIDGIQLAGNRWLHRDAFAQLQELALDAVREHHAAVPTDPWVGFAGVRARVTRFAPDEALRAALDAAARAGRLESGAHAYRLPGHAPHAADPAIAQAVLERIENAQLGPPTQEELAQELGVDARALQPVLEHWVREQRLYRIAAGRYFACAAVDALRARVLAFLERHGQIDPNHYKELTGQSRKHTVPLMEYFDAQKLTRREGNVRVLRAR